MPSWQARCANMATRWLIRRRDWSPAMALTARARLLFGAPRLYGWLATRGLAIAQVASDGIRGEWIAAPGASDDIILYIHGGGYVACSPSTHRPITCALARMSRCRVFSADYRLAPEHPFPAAIDDVFATYEWLLANRAPGARIAIAGDSAGGGLTLALLVRARDAGLPLPSRAVCFSPWTDLAGTGASVTGNDGHCAMFRPENMPQFASVYLGTTSPREALASPLYADLRNLPPVLFQVGSTELLLDDSRRVQERIRMSGGESQIQIFDDVMHCWQMLVGFVPEARVALQLAATFIRADQR